MGTEHRATTALSQLADRIAIQDVVHRYARGVDRRDWDLVRSCYADDAVDNHGAYVGGVDGLIEWMVDRHSGIASSMHFITNSLVEFAGSDAAVCESYTVTIQRPERDRIGTALAMYGLGGVDDIRADQTLESEVRCRFVDRFVRGPAGWLIEQRSVVYDTFVGRLVPMNSNFGSDWAVSTRDPDDPLFLVRHDAGIRANSTGTSS